MASAQDWQGPAALLSFLCPARPNMHDNQWLRGVHRAGRQLAVCEVDRSEREIPEMGIWR
jgi:hypothetical protein